MAVEALRSIPARCTLWISALHGQQKLTVIVLRHTHASLRSSQAADRSSPGQRAAVQSYMELDRDAL